MFYSTMTTNLAKEQNLIPHPCNADMHYRNYCMQLTVFACGVWCIVVIGNDITFSATDQDRYHSEPQLSLECECGSLL